MGFNTSKGRFATDPYKASDLICCRFNTSKGRFATLGLDGDSTLGDVSIPLKEDLQRLEMDTVKDDEGFQYL